MNVIQQAQYIIAYKCIQFQNATGITVFFF